MLKLYSMIDSGNCYKPRLLLAKLGRPFAHVEVSSLDGSTRTPEYLAKNPNGKVPLLELSDGRTLPESNAILLFLSEETQYLPKGRYDRACVYQWLFFEQYSHEPNIAVRRSLMKYPQRAADATPAKLQATLEGGEKALDVMERRLSKFDWLAGNSITVADIALYAYTHDMETAGFEPRRYPSIAMWLNRVRDDPGHVPMDWVPDG